MLKVKGYPESAQKKEKQQNTENIFNILSKNKHVKQNKRNGKEKIWNEEKESI